MASDAYARQVGWLEAAAMHREELKESARVTEEKENTFEPQMATRRKTPATTPVRGVQPKPSSLVAHASHLRRYAMARDEKSRAAAVLTRSTSTSSSSSSSSRSSRRTATPNSTALARVDSPAATPRRAMMPPAMMPPTTRPPNTPSVPPTPYELAERESFDDDDDHEEEGDDAEDESFFAQLQRERARWDREHSKLLTVIDLQQRELNNRGLKAEERARSIAVTFTDSVAQFESRLIKLERDVDGELSSIRKLAERLLASADRAEAKASEAPRADPTLARLDGIEAQLAALNAKLLENNNTSPTSTVDDASVVALH